MKQVSIVIPVYNRAGYLPRLFNSLSAITYDRLHVILVDNGSTDDSLSICQAFAVQATFPVQVLVEPRKGAAMARNTGLAACTTEWVYFFDSDDELSDNFLDVLMPLTDNLDALFLTTKQIYTNKIYVRAYKPSGDVSDQILSSMLNSPAMLLRSEWLKQIGGWNTSLTVWDDWELGIRVLLAKPRFRWYTKQPFHKLYVHDESITGPSMSHNLSGKVDCLRQVLDVLETPAQRKALYLRTKIFEGYLRREGVRTTLDLSFRPMSSLTHLCGWLLKFYIGMGGRGAWRIAMMM